MPNDHPIKILLRNRVKGLIFSSQILLYLLGVQNALADEVVLNTGEKFSSSKVWEEDGKIRFNMHGLIVSVNKSDVATIIGNDGMRHQFTAPTPQSQPAQPNPQPNQNAQLPVPPESPPVEPAYRPKAPKQKPAPAPKGAFKNRHANLGLKGIRWLASPADIPDLEKLKQDPAYGGIDQYYRPDERLQFGQALIDGKVYGFWRNKLYSVMMWAEGHRGYERLREAVLSRYGKGQKNGKGLERYVWHDSTTDQMLQFDTELNTGFFWMRSRHLDAQIKKRYPNG